MVSELLSVMYNVRGGINGVRAPPQTMDSHQRYHKERGTSK